MKKEKNLSQGVTALELLMVVAIMAILAAIVISPFAQFRNSKVLDTAGENALSILARARGNTLSSKNSYQYGVHFESAQMVLFRGAIYNSLDANNEAVALDGALEIYPTPPSLTGGGSDVIFDRLTGKTSQDGTVVIRVKSDTSKTRTITVNATGVVSAN